MKNLTKKSLVTILNVFFFSIVAFSQGNIEGVVKDSISNENISFASVALKKDGKIINSSMTDYEGYFFFDEVKRGQYTLVLNYAGKSKEFTDVEMISGNLTFTLEIDPTNELPIVIVKGIPGLIIPEHIDKYEVEFIDNIGAVNITDIESLGSSQVETPNGISYKGARPGTSVYYIDGMRTYGDLYMPMSAVESVVIYNSGIPAKYGNTTSAVIVVETKSFLDRF